MRLSKRIEVVQDKPGFVLKNDFISVGVVYMVELSCLKDLEKSRKNSSTPLTPTPLRRKETRSVSVIPVCTGRRCESVAPS